VRLQATHTSTSNSKLVMLRAPELGNKIVGIWEMDRIPPNIPLRKLFRANSPISEVVLCRDEAALVDASTARSKPLKTDSRRHGLPDSAEKIAPIPGSGYRIMPLSDDKAEYVVFLNCSALDSDEIDFTMAYVGTLQMELWRAREIDTRMLMTAVVSIESRLQSQIGFQFFPEPNYLKETIRFASNEMIRAWAENRASKSIIHKIDRAVLSKFLARRIDLIERVGEIALKDVALTGSYYQFFSLFLKLTALYDALPEESSLRNPAAARLERFSGIAIRQIEEKGLPSLAKAASSLQHFLSVSGVFKDQITYEKTVPVLLDNAASGLRAEFVDLSGAAFLASTAREICFALGVEPDQIPEPLIHEFLELCKRISQRKDTYQLTALIASRMELDVLISLGYFIQHPSICPKVALLATETFKRFLGSEIKLKSGFPELFVEDSDLYMDVIGAMGFCTFFGRFDLARDLQSLIVSGKDTKSGRTAWAFVLWRNFLAFEDYDSLLELRSILPEIKSAHEPRNELLQPTFQMFELLADASVIEDGRAEKLAEARQIAARMSISPEVLVKSVLEREGVLSMIETLQYLYAAVDSQSTGLLSSNLRHAIESIYSFAMNERRSSPNRLMLLKTLLLEKIVLRRYKEVMQIGAKVAHHPFASENAKRLSSYSMSWADAKIKGSTDAVIAALNAEGGSFSPWIRIAEKAIQTNARDDYRRVVSDRAKLRTQPRRIGKENYLKGILMETSLYLHFAHKGYAVTNRLILDGTEIVDVFCQKQLKGHFEIVCVDVKNTKRKYGRKEAADFALRFKHLCGNMDIFLPVGRTGEVTLIAVVASRSGVTTRAIVVLKEQLGEVPIQILSKDEISEMLKSGELQSSCSPSSVNPRNSMRGRDGEIS